MLVVSSALLRAFVDHAEEHGEDSVFPRERCVTIFRSVAQLLLMEISAFYGYPPPTSMSFCIEKLNNRLRHD